MTGLEIPEWLPEWPERGDRSLRRVSASPLGAPLDRVCPEQVAKKVHLGVWPDTPYEPAVYPEYQGFWLGLARDALLLLLDRWDAPPPTVASVPAAVEQAIRFSQGEWEDPSKVVAARAVSGYLDALRVIRDSEPGWGDAKFVSDFVATDVHGSAVTEWWGWAVHVVRDGGRVRETHLLRYRAAGTRPAADARVAALGRVLADGVVAAPGSRWSDPFDPYVSQPATPERVVVREVGVLDATSHVLLDATPSDARDFFAARVPAVIAVLGGGAYTPGSRCADCNVRKVCSGVVKPYGILGMADYSAWTRSVSPADLSDYAVCPLRVHLARDLGLPRTPTTAGHAAVRGIRVHQWLEAAHTRGVACRPDDLAPAPMPAVAADLGWTEAEYLETRPWLLGHLDNCGLAGEVTDVHTEHDVTVFDTDANVVFSTRVDLAYRRPGVGRVIRETKTMSFNRMRDSLGETELDLISLFPQIAFAIASLAQGWDPIASSGLDTTDGHGLVELEVLGDGQEFVVAFDPTDADTAMTARQEIAQAVHSRMGDRAHRAVTGPHCRWCPMRDWCPARIDHATWDPDVRLDPTSDPRLHIDLAAQTASPIDDDEPPF